MDLVPGAHLHNGRYELTRRLGTGGFGEVWAARDTSLGREVAIKVLHRDEIPGLAAAQRFAQEAQAASNLQHGHIVTVYDYVQPAAGNDEPVLLVMEYIPGRTLERMLDDFGPAPDDRVLAWGRQIAEALGNAHSREPALLHRDVKPANIIIREKNGEACLVDFGIAVMLTAAQERLTQTGHVIGSPQFMSPEQRVGESLTPASDVYSLAVVLASARAAPGAPVPGGTDVDLRFAAFSDVLSRALLFDAGRRYQDGFQFASALRAVAEGGQQALAAARDAAQHVAAAGPNAVVRPPYGVAAGGAAAEAAPPTVRDRPGRPVPPPPAASGLPTPRDARSPRKTTEPAGRAKTGWRRKARTAALLAVFTLVVVLATVVAVVVVLRNGDDGTSAAAETSATSQTPSASSSNSATSTQASTSSSSVSSTRTTVTRATPTPAGVPWSPNDTFVGVSGDRTIYSTGVSGLVDGTPVSDGIAVCWDIDDSPGSTTGCTDIAGNISADFRVIPATRVTGVIGLADYSPLSCEAQVTVLDGDAVVADQSTTAGAVRLDDYVMQTQILQVQVQIVAGSRGSAPSNCGLVIGTP